MPPQIAPYHLRIDWLMWFAALSPQRAERWLRPNLAYEPSDALTV